MEECAPRYGGVNVVKRRENAVLEFRQGLAGRVEPLADFLHQGLNQLQSRSADFLLDGVQEVLHRLLCFRQCREMQLFPHRVGKFCNGGHGVSNEVRQLLNAFVENVVLPDGPVEVYQPVARCRRNGKKSGGKRPEARQQRFNTVEQSCKSLNADVQHSKYAFEGPLDFVHRAFGQDKPLGKLMQAFNNAIKLLRGGRRENIRPCLFHCAEIALKRLADVEQRLEQQFSAALPGHVFHQFRNRAGGTLGLLFQFADCLHLFLGIACVLQLLVAQCRQPFCGAGGLIGQLVQRLNQNIRGQPAFGQGVVERTRFLHHLVKVGNGFRGGLLKGGPKIVH